MANPIFRVDEILRYCKGKSVLHLGFIAHSSYEDAIARNEWAHGWIGKVASRLVGIDYLADAVDKIKVKYGYESYFGDAMDLDKCAINEKFDVIVCGELIEHLTNPGLMLDGIKRFMREDSILIVTTPNVWARTYLQQFRENENEKVWVNPEHVHWYSYFTLSNTMERHGYDKVSYDYYFHFNTREQYFEVPKGPAGKLRTFIRNRRMNNSKKTTEIGLFFVAKLSNKTPEKTPAELVKEFYK